MPGEDEIVPQGQSLPLTQDERLTAQFYAWEKRGRGWQLWEHPVELEPPFRPFLFHYVEPSPTIDDARKPTLLSSAMDSLFRRRPAETVAAPLTSVFEVPEPLPEVFADEDALVAFQVSLPPGTKTTKEAAERLLLSFTHCSFPVGFEVVGTHDAIVTQFVCRPSDRPQLAAQLPAYFPEAAVFEHPADPQDLWDEAQPAVIVDFGLSREFMLPLRSFRGFEVDPLIGTAGALADFGTGERGLFQILFQAVRYPWAESVLRAVTDWEGRSFFADAPEMVALAKEKIAQPLFAAVVRVAAQSPTPARAWQIVKALGASLTPFSSPTSNEFIPLTNDGYAVDIHAEDMLRRRTRRSGMLLNTDELVSLVHLPSASVRVPKLKREEMKTKAAPALASAHRLVLGENRHAGKVAQVTLSPEQRVRHTYVIGASGTGKSTLLLNLIIQDIANGEGIAVLDPHGDLIDEVLGHIPESRSRDVVLLDPSDEEYPVGFNILSAHSELEKNLLGSDLVAVFRRLSTSWGDQMTSVLGNAILAILESTKGGTLADLRRLLVEGDFRQAFLGTVRDPEVVYYWQREFPLLTGKPQGPILTRLDTFLRPKLIRHMVCQKENRLDFGAIMNEGKIFLAKLAQGAIGEENAYLLGALLVSKFHQLAMSRQQVAASERRNFYLYIDEFHNFVTPSMAAILSGARKYHLGLILAHQELHQLWNKDTDVASAVISNPYTRICFRLGDFDAKKLEAGFSFFEARDLQNLEVGEAICRMERSEYDFNLKTLPLLAVEPAAARVRRERVIALSRERYAARREDVEASLARVAPPVKVEQQVPEKPVVRKEKAEPPVPAPSEPTETQGAPGLQPSVPEPVLGGRGGPQHKYLQELIKRWGESKGYQTAIEKQILDGRGAVDVVLEKEGISIACEISVTSTTDWELGNIQKCLVAGFDHVILVSADAKMLDKASKAIRAALDKAQSKKVRFLAPERLPGFLDGLAGRPAGEPGAAESDEVLTAKEVERMLKIDVKTIYGYVERGLLPYVRIQSNLRFVKSEILKWIEDHRFRPKPPGSRK